MKLINLLIRHYRFWRAKVLRLLDIKGRTAWISAPECLAHFVSSGSHPENPERIRVIEKVLRRSHVWPLLQKIIAPEVSDIQLARVHTRAYLASLENQIPISGSIKIDEDTYLSQDTLKAARYSAGAVVKAVDMVMKKQAKNAFCAIRPPGHHAFADKASGFCFINNVAVGVMHAIAEYNIPRIAILDFDLHHGDGTESIFAGDSRVLFLSSFEYPLYPYNKDFPLPECPENSVRTLLQAGDGSHKFRDAIREEWLPRLEAFQPEFIFISAGFDAHQRDELGHLNLNEDDFEWLTKKIMLLANRYAKGRIVSILEGGYQPRALSASVKAHLACLIKASPFY